MKVGIVTQPLLGNYGGILQNYALQTILRRLGHEPITIDYIWNMRWYRFILSYFKSFLSKTIRGKKSKFEKFYPVRENKFIDNFISNHIVRTDYTYHYRQSQLNKYAIQAVVSGSDQVWRPKYNPDLKDMFLDFVKDDNILKIAYAASFGCSEKEYSRQMIFECERAAKRLDAISVREESGVDLCLEYFGVKAQTVLDPTMLLTADDYYNLTHNFPKSEHKYLGAYILDEDPTIEDTLEKICDIQSLSTIRRITEDESSMSPIDWLAMIRDADFIVTNSFHGTVFAIIFQKPFLSIYNDNRGGDRFYSLLAPLNLLDRLVVSNSDKIEDIVRRKIDWKSVNQSINLRRTKSISFLKDSLRLKEP